MIDRKYRIKTFESLYCVFSIAAFIVIGFVITIFIFAVNPIAIKIMVGMDLISIPFFLIIYRGDLELTLTDDKILIHWIKKPYIKKVSDKTIDNKNIIIICTDWDTVIRNQSHIMCQIVQIKDNFVFYVADNSKRQKELSILKSGFRKLVQIENEKRPDDNKIHLKLNY